MYQQKVLNEAEVNGLTWNNTYEIL